MLKFINRLVGMIVITVALAFFILSKVNDMHFLKGSFSEWVTSVDGHISAIASDTKSFFRNEGITLPAIVKNNGDGSYTLTFGDNSYRFSVSGEKENASPTDQ